MKELISNIYQWAENRNFFSPNGVTQQTMFVKFVEELGEYARHIARGEDTTDDIGDIAVLTIITGYLLDRKPTYRVPENHNCGFGSDYWLYRLTSTIGGISENLMFGKPIYSTNLENIMISLHQIAIEQGTSLELCLEKAYNNIKDRKGHFENGFFIKESDKNKSN